MLKFEFHIFFTFVIQSLSRVFVTLCDPMDCSMPAFPVHHHLLELAQTHVCRLPGVFTALSLAPPAVL